MKMNWGGFLVLRPLILLVPAVLFFVLVSQAVSVEAALEGPYSGDARVPGQYIVVLKDSVTDADAVQESLERSSRAERLDTYRYALRGFSARLTSEAAEKLAHDPRVEFVSEDRMVSIALDAGRLEADPRASSRDDARESARNPTSPASTAPSQIFPTGIRRVGAVDLLNTGAGVQVAVIDTGIQTTHPDLSANIAGGKNCLRSGNYQDQNGHGTHVAGTIAGVNNAEGVAGVAPSAKLWAVRVLDKKGSGTWSQVICGLDFVTSKAPANGGSIKVANLSLGGSGTSDNNCGLSNNDALHRAICRARDAGVTIVVAAGNSGASASGFVPAAYDDAVITVSALADSDGAPGGEGPATSYGADDTFASFSNYGTVVDIGAPGVNIYSTWLSGGYKTISGTSMASPHTAGAAALYLASHPGALWESVRDALILAGEPLGEGHTDPSGKHKEPVLEVSAL